jgi:large conductance mechanosensitive channel
VLKDFRAFIFRGNLLDLAVAFILGVAFSAVVKAFTDGIIMAFIAAIFGKPNFDAVSFKIGHGVILIGTFLTAVLNFLIIAAVLFLILKAAEKAMRRREAEADSASPAPTDETVLLTEIRDLLAAQAAPPAPAPKPRSR